MTRLDASDRPIPLGMLLSAWLPLAIMWILMAVEQPLISAVISRTGEAKRQLAAFGFTFALALFIEGPVIQMLAAGTAIAENRENYKKLLLFMHVIGWGATAIHLILTLPGVFYPMADTLFSLPESLWAPSRASLLFMLPWTVAVGYRRLWQGVLIRYNKTRVIPVTMVVRLGTSAAILAFGYFTRHVTGAALGALALSGGTIAGAVAAGLFARPVIRELPEASSGQGAAPIGWKALIAFYVPLALTNFLNLGARPLMNLGVARGHLPVESLALWPVLFAYFFLFTSLTLSLQEIVIARLKGPDSYRSLSRFVGRISLILFAVFLLVMATPLWKMWFYGVSGLKEDLGTFIPLCLLILLPLPLLTGFISLFRGSLVTTRRTKVITTGVLINITVLLGGIFWGVKSLSFPAIYIATFSFSLATILEALFLRLMKARAG